MFIHSRQDKTHQDSHGNTSLAPPPKNKKKGWCKCKYGIAEWALSDGVRVPHITSRRFPGEETWKSRPPRMVEAAMACVVSRLRSASPVPFTFAKLLRTHRLVCLVLSGLNEHDNTFERYYHVDSLQTRQDKPRQPRQHKPCSTTSAPPSLPPTPPTTWKVRFKSRFLGPKAENVWLCVLFLKQCLFLIG